MTTTNGGGDTEALRLEIARTRAELGETVQALAAKADVKARARDQVEQTKQRVRQRAAHFADTVKGQAGSVRDAGGGVTRNPVPIGALLGAAAALVIVLIVIRGRNNR
jgi:hypothetical protein